jgi:hypothetical protein
MDTRKKIFVLCTFRSMAAEPQNRCGNNGEIYLCPLWNINAAVLPVTSYYCGSSHSTVIFEFNISPQKRA